MCARMTLTRTDLGDVADELGAVIEDGAVASYRARFNVAPSDRHVIVRADGARRVLGPAGWGLAREGATGLHINARAETAAFRPTFREAFVNRRCVVVADGFYEWKRDGARRQPYWLHRADGRLLLLAGLFERARDERRFVVLTTAPNELLATIHDRMPAVIAPDEVDRWLAAPERGLLRPAAPGVLVSTPVSPWVNSVRHDDPACLQPVDPEAPGPGQLDLF